MASQRPYPWEDCRQPGEARRHSVAWECTRQALSPTIAVSPVHPRPMLKADAAPLGRVRLITHSVPTAREVDAGTVVLAMGWETLSGRRPRYRWEACFAQHDTELLWGQAVPPQALNDETAGRVLARLDDLGTLRRCPACAVRASTRFGVERRSGHVDTPSRRVWGASPCAATQALPVQGTSGSSQDTRPDLQPCGLSPLGVERAVPLWGKPADGQAADKSLQTPLGSERAQRLAGHGVAPGASRDLAAAALVTAAQRAALGDTLCLPR